MDETMKELSEKYPKAWEDFSQWWDDDVSGAHERTYYAHELEFNTIFGYLVLEYFPKHGIVITSDFESFDHYEEKFELSWDIWTAKGRMNDESIETPEEAILKAFEIREGQIK